MTGPDLARLFSAIASPVAPDGSLPAGVAGRLAAAHVERGVEGIYCCGSSGEGLLLSVAERRLLLEEVVAAVDGAVPVVAHVGAASTRDALELARHAAAAGAVAVSMIPPIYYRYTADEVIGHYRDVMDAALLPMILYNIPQFTGQEFQADHPLLADPRVVGVKHTAHSMYQLERMARAHPELHLINGFDETYLAATVAGATGTIGTTVSLQVDCFKAVRALVRRGDLARAQEFQRRINDVIEVLVDVGVFPAAKWVESRLTGVDLGPCRAPFAEVDADGARRLEGLVERIGQDAEEARAAVA
ncbi:MAG: dihydrodipicolinate synthase family protein [Arachnia sp.]